MRHTSITTNRQTIAISSCRRAASPDTGRALTVGQSAHAGQGGDHLLLEEFH